MLKNNIYPALKVHVLEYPLFMNESTQILNPDVGKLLDPYTFSSDYVIHKTYEQ